MNQFGVDAPKLVISLLKSKKHPCKYPCILLGFLVDFWVLWNLVGFKMLVFNGLDPVQTVQCGLDCVGFQTKKPFSQSAQSSPNGGGLFYVLVINRL